MKQRFIRPDDELEDDEELIPGAASSIRRSSDATHSECFTVMTVRTIRTLGLQLAPTGRNPRHYTVTLRSVDEDVAALVSADHHVWTNPYHET